ncbi:hypothetical protein [Streptomyces hydrogenans]
MTNLRAQDVTPIGERRPWSCRGSLEEAATITAKLRKEVRVKA